MTSSTCTCAAVYAGHDRVGTSWRESCAEHGIGTDWFEHHEGPDGTTMRERYELFRRRLFPTLPPNWTAEDDLDDEGDDDDDDEDE